MNEWKKQEEQKKMMNTLSHQLHYSNINTTAQPNTEKKREKDDWKKKLEHNYQMKTLWLYSWGLNEFRFFLSLRNMIIIDQFSMYRCLLMMIKSCLCVSVCVYRTERARRKKKLRYTFWKWFISARFVLFCWNQNYDEMIFIVNHMLFLFI